MAQNSLDDGGSGYFYNLRCEKNSLPIPTGPMDRQIRIDKISKDQTLQLRHSVLWPDLPLSHVCLPEDDAGFHYGAFSPQRDTPIAVISLFRENIPTDKETLVPGPGLSSANLITLYCEAVRFRKFVCEPQYQGQGYGSQLLLHALSMARSEWGVTMAWCDARTETQEWYKRRGFQPFGPKFFKGAVEYVRMKADLKDLEREETVLSTA
jgi:GNAT superfamily N-acetyltransferase